MKTRISVALGVAMVMGSWLAAQEPSTPKAPEAPEGAAAARSHDEQAIKGAYEAFSQSFQKGDAKALVELFTPEGETADAEGGILHGRDALLQHYTSQFGGGTGDQIKTSVESVTFLDGMLARAAGTSEIVPAGGGATHHSRFHGLHIKRDGRWYLASLRELPSSDLAPQEHLKQLEWLIGDWIEETADAVVHTSYKWSEDKASIHRTFSVSMKGQPAFTGTQRIGWDPLTKQIKSWVFDSRGGYGDGLWVRSGNQWFIKATGVRSDGRVATATQILTFVNKDQLEWKSTDRTLGADVEPEVLEIVMVRKPPEPK
ncbi:SgcJ/EcaC family oxidoreductase [Singulisphaera sp. PoT]|uniref:SgcJ/EcaC family oxidoreductase n=1 Tax=Singulisphaera sp. PoT TaxID=3411797 RepID=UPI003BF5F8D9